MKSCNAERDTWLSLTPVHSLDISGTHYCFGWKIKKEKNSPDFHCLILEGPPLNFAHQFGLVDPQGVITTQPVKTVE